jgi:hypothetical protein
MTTISLSSYPGTSGAIKLGIDANAKCSRIDRQADGAAPQPGAKSLCELLALYEGGNKILANLRSF